MANEAEIINNPDSTPGAVSTGYQAQNTNLVAQRTGIDKTYVSGGVGTATVEISGPVDVNGVLYDIKSQTVLTPPSAGRYYITLQGAGPQYLTPTLGTSAGTFDPLKNARYDSSGYRILNWVIYFNGTTCYANRLLTPETENNYLPDINEPEETWITSNGNWTAKRSKYYKITMTGKGGNASSNTSAGASTVECSGGAGLTGFKRIFIEAGDTWTATFSTSEGGNLIFTNGVTTLTVGNANYWSGGNSNSGMDFTHNGAPGNYSSDTLQANGAPSYWGGGGVWWYTTSFGQRASNGSSYGSGGGYNRGQIGTGKQGVIRIIG